MSWIWSRRSCWIQLGSEGPQADNGLVELWFCGGETSALMHQKTLGCDCTGESFTPRRRRSKLTLQTGCVGAARLSVDVLKCGPGCSVDGPRMNEG